MAWFLVTLPIARYRLKRELKNYNADKILNTNRP